MKIELLEEKVVVRGKRVIEIDYNEIDSVSLKVRSNSIWKCVLVLYLILFFIILSKNYISLFVMIIYLTVLFFLLFYKFDEVKANATLFYKDKKIKMNLNDENLESTKKLIEILKLNNYNKLTDAAS